MGVWFLVYCQQTSNILVYLQTGGLTSPVYSIPLGWDPTPEAVQRGRDTWYDASLSMNGRTSCNTCHPQGGADGLVWNIADVPVDDKGVMVTQPLFGIEDTFPYHWRGERRFRDFNVFEELLGAPPGTNFSDQEGAPPFGDLADFQDFVFSLQPPANPRQSGPLEVVGGRLVRDYDRRLKSSLVSHPRGSVTRTTPRAWSASR